jgi:predicted transporter
MNEENEELLREMRDKYERRIILMIDASVGYLLSASSTLAVEFILHHDKFLTAAGFHEHLLTALGTGLVGSGLYLAKPGGQKAGSNGQTVKQQQLNGDGNGTI